MATRIAEDLLERESELARAVEFLNDARKSHGRLLALFVTRNTVENHLGRIYPKLDIHSREQLGKALAAEAP